MNSNSEIPDEPGADVSPRTLMLLERLDSLAHVVVAVFFLVLSTSVLIAALIMFIKDIWSTFSEKAEAATFTHDSLEVLSTLLFAVIILELLRTIITYLQTRDTKAIMKEFLIVGIISSIRKILMVGAESSIVVKPEVNKTVFQNGISINVDSAQAAKSMAGSLFVQEATGVVISVVAILLMIGGLIMLNRFYGAHEETKGGA